jgi:hypothetical protein
MENILTGNTQENKVKFPIPFEPHKSNRFIIKSDGTEIPDYLFRNYKIYNDNDIIFFETEFIETINVTINPLDLFKIIGFSIQNLDPTGVVTQELYFEVKGLNFEKTASYNDNTLLTTKLKVITKNMRFIINSNI